MAKEEFRVYNSMTQQKEVFTTKEPGKVGMYVCGITAYDFSHIGHARAAVNFDVLYRYLKHLGYEVTYVRNFTDVDDKGPQELGSMGKGTFETIDLFIFLVISVHTIIAKVLEERLKRLLTSMVLESQIIRRANESGENPFALSDRFCQEYLSDMADLQCLSPTHQPRVSDHLEQIKDMITQCVGIHTDITPSGKWSVFDKMHLKDEFWSYPIQSHLNVIQSYGGRIEKKLCGFPSAEIVFKDPKQGNFALDMVILNDLKLQIIKNGYGYAVDGDVFFSVDKFPNYGQLSGQKLENHRAGERVAVDSRKNNPADFALWKAAKPGEPSWESPWGPGRPGWHIECSAMSAHYLTFKFDIHGGGIDLIFPHHENEVAQSCAACQESKISYWMHNGHVTNNNEKMSKSLGNFFTIRQITERYHPLVLRHFLISAHYRSPLNYTVSQLDSASDTVYYIYQVWDLFSHSMANHLTLYISFLNETCDYARLRRCFITTSRENLSDGLGKTGKKDPVSSAAEECIINLRSEFQTRMADDLNTAHILTGAFQEALKFINSTLTSLKKKQPKKQQLSMIQSLVNVKKELREVLDVLDCSPHLLTLKFISYFASLIFALLLLVVLTLQNTLVLQQLKDKALKRAGMVEDDILHLIEERTQARKDKNFGKSDNIRAKLSSLGIALMDVGRETIWRPCVPVEPAVLVPPANRRRLKQSKSQWSSKLLSHQQVNSKQLTMLRQTRQKRRQPCLPSD
ncbi:hypothetical protein CSA_022906, partial [Cucumis sativus]